MKNRCLNLIFVLIAALSFSQITQVSIVSNVEGMKLVVNGEDFMVNGMNWDYFPIGTNYSYSLWDQSDDLIKAALDTEMGLLKDMGVNAIRVYTGIQPKWIQFIYEKYGIYTMLNHSFGRYGLTVNGAWIGNTEYSDAATQKILLKEVTDMVREYKDTPGLLMYLLGNENNYGLFWGGAETEDIPVEDRQSTVRARAMYKMFNEATLAMKAIDKSVPIAMCNGDLLFNSIIAEECKDVDIFGTNMYRGASFGDAFERVKNELNKPILFTEFGADAFNAIKNEEDQYSQAYYTVCNWKEIYENAAGLGKSGNSIGGFTFQFSDGWWKYGQTTNLDVHDTNATWANAGYDRDFIEGQNNMNEEWFGICAKGPTNARGLYDLYPRAAYYALKEAHRLNPYDHDMTVSTIDNYFKNINLGRAVLKARRYKTILGSSEKVINHYTNLVLEDEFDVDGAPNSSLWTYDIGNGTEQGIPGWGNNELQYYTNRPENVKVQNGMLHITAQRETFMGANFTSARIKSQGLFENAYGRYEARIQLPWGQGIWPAFWLLGGNCEQITWPKCGEIDIMEFRGQDLIKVHGSVHGPGYSAGNAVTKSYSLTNDRFDSDFHIFGIEWGPNFINFYVDDVLYNQITPEDVSGEWVFDHPFYIIMNVAVGGSFVGPPNNETQFPQTMLVDYIRVYK